MESTCFKTLKLQIVCKMLAERCETGPLYASFSNVLQNNFKVIYRDQTTIETFTLPAICIFKRSNPILYLIFQNSVIFVSFVTSLSPNRVKRAQGCISCIEGDRKIKINI